MYLSLLLATCFFGGSGASQSSLLFPIRGVCWREGDWLLGVPKTLEASCAFVLVAAGASFAVDDLRPAGCVGACRTLPPKTSVASCFGRSGGCVCRGVPNTLLWFISALLVGFFCGGALKDGFDAGVCSRGVPKTELCCCAARFEGLPAAGLLLLSFFCGCCRGVLAPNTLDCCWPNLLFSRFGSTHASFGGAL